MFENDSVLIEDIFIKNIKNPILMLKGKKYQNINLKIMVDNTEKNLIDCQDPDYKYVQNRILKHNQNNFCFYSNIPTYAKKIELYCNGKLIFKMKTSIIKRITNKLSLNLKKLKRIPKVFIKSIRVLWHKHHFLVPPRLLKQYILSLKKNMNSKTVDELYYNPLIDNEYRKWVHNNKKEIEKKSFNYNPLISIIIPTYNVSSSILSECLDSILNQSYQNFEICIADDNSTLEETIDTLKEYEKNKKIKIVYRTTNGHISEASNSALKIAKGEFIALVDNDDVLDKDALYYMVEKLNENKEYDLIYSDEDKLDLNGNRCCPHFKPDFSLDTLLTINYICHFTMIRKSIIDKLNGFRSEYNGAQDYDLFLRVIDLTDKIGHVSKILYHWRMTPNSTALAGSNKNYAYIAGKKALEDYVKRNKIKARVNELSLSQMYYMDYYIEKEPTISIIIPIKDRSDITKKCIDSIYNKTNYKNYEIILIDNFSIEEKTSNMIKEYQKRKNFKSIRLECEFNYSYINNVGVKESLGEYVVFLNNDTEIISSDWLKIMVGYASQKHIACVGAKLLYPNKTVQHCGVVTGVGGVAMHVNVGAEDSELGYFGRLSGVYDWSCVTAGCLMINKDKFLSVNGFDEKLKVAFNDVDLCLKLIDKGYYNVVLPQVKLFHYESLSRGNDLDYDKRQRVLNEVDIMCDKWNNKLINDKFYNCNFSLGYPFRLDKEK